MTRTAVAADFVPRKLLRVIALEQQVADLMGYVTLWNDVRPIVDGARRLYDRLIKVSGGSPVQNDIEALGAAIERYEALYPEHVR